VRAAREIPGVGGVGRQNFRFSESGSNVPILLKNA
jgi:hypothetical protein